MYSCLHIFKVNKKLCAYKQCFCKKFHVKLNLYKIIGTTIKTVFLSIINFMFV